MATKESKSSNEDKLLIIRTALDLMLKVLPKYIADILQENDKRDWWQKFVLEKLPENTTRDLPKNDYINNLDLSLCIKIIIQNWHSIFKHKMKNVKLSWVHEILEYRNEVSHLTNERLNTLSNKEIERALDTMERFMHPVNSNVADKISKMMKGKRKFTSKPKPIKSHSASPSRKTNNNKTLEEKVIQKTIHPIVKKEEKENENINGIRKIKLTTENSKNIRFYSRKTGEETGLNGRGDKSLLELFVDKDIKYIDTQRNVKVGNEIILTSEGKKCYIAYSRNEDKWYIKEAKEKIGGYVINEKPRDYREYINVYLDDILLNNLNFP